MKKKEKEKKNTPPVAALACPQCQHTPRYMKNEREIARLKQRLTAIAGEGHYYRGEECQLSEFRLLQCPDCGVYYEDGHHYYSDPESTMGLARDEEDWYAMEKLDADAAAERLRQLR
ncbi:MAG TPA: hypothetical protein PKH77_26260 [Anaerolineae bacterium]|nr:hypothetical protein [Anaerolineae bacterium]